MFYVTLFLKFLQACRVYAAGNGGTTLKQAYLRYVAALLLFGTNGIVASRIALSSVEIVLLRTLIGSLLLLAVFCAGKQKLAMRGNGKSLLFVVLSGAAMGAGWIFLYEAYAQIGVGIASLLYYCGPVLVMALSPLLFRERLTFGKIAGFLCVLCGIWLVSGRPLGSGESGFGFFCGIMSAVMYALMVICNKKAAGITGLANATIQLCSGFLTVAVIVGVRQGFALQIAPSSVVPILVLGLVNTGLGCCLYFSAIGRLPIQSVAVCGYLEPLAAVLFSVVFLRETMTPLQAAGVLLMVGGAVCAECCTRETRT